MRTKKERKKETNDKKNNLKTQVTLFKIDNDTEIKKTEFCLTQ